MALLETVWAVVTGTVTLTTGTLYLLERYKYVSARPKWLRGLRKPDIGNDIRLLVKKLAQVGDWMDNLEGENPLKQEIRHDIGDVEWKVWKETYSYFALHSKDEELVKLALRNLSQVQGREAIMRALKYITEKKDDIVKVPSNEVGKLIDAVLAELNELLKIQSYPAN